MEFTYVLRGCEESSHDGRVLRYVLSRPNVLKVAQGNDYKTSKYLVIIIFSR